MVKSAIGYPQAPVGPPRLWRGRGRRATPELARLANASFFRRLPLVLASLVPPGGGGVPISPVTKAELPARLQALGAAVERWAEATRFAAEPGKLMLIPDAAGRLGHVLAGVAEGDRLWALAHCPDALPEGRYALDGVGGRDDATRIALGWALGSYGFT